MIAPGFGVQFLSIDGFDKGPIVEAVGRRCSEAGLRTRRVSWQRELARAAAGDGDGDGDGDASSYPVRELGRIWLNLYRTFFAGARADGLPVGIPGSYSEATEVAKRLQGADISNMQPALAAATAWLELSGHTILHDAVVGPLKAAGYVVLQDSLGAKNILKSLLMAGYDGAFAAAEAMTATRSRALEYCARAFPPDLGVFLLNDPAELLAARTANLASPFDSYGAFGGDRAQTYLDLQGSCVTEFTSFAGRHGWLTFDLRGDSPPTARQVAGEIVAEIQERRVEVRG